MDIIPARAQLASLLNSTLEESIDLQPSSADAHTSQCSSALLRSDQDSYFSNFSEYRFGKRLHHITYSSSRPCLESSSVCVFFQYSVKISTYTRPRIASSLAPEDPEIAFNLAAVLEACTSVCNFPLSYPCRHD